MPASRISSACCGKRRPLVLMQAMMPGNIFLISRNVARAYGVAKVSPGPATPTTVISGQISRALRTAATASAGEIMLAATPGRTSSLPSSRRQKRQLILQPGETGRWILPRLGFAPTAKQGCAFVSSENDLLMTSHSSSQSPSATTCFMTSSTGPDASKTRLPC